GEFASADASALSEAASRINLYPAGALKTDSVLVLGTTDVVYVTTLVLSAGASALEVTVYTGADATADAGEVLADVFLPVNGAIVVDLAQAPYRGPLGAGGIPYPKVKTSAAGAVRVQLFGTVHRAQG